MTLRKSVNFIIPSILTKTFMTQNRMISVKISKNSLFSFKLIFDIIIGLIIPNHSLMCDQNV